MFDRDQPIRAHRGDIASWYTMASQDTDQGRTKREFLREWVEAVNAPWWIRTLGLGVSMGSW